MTPYPGDSRIDVAAATDAAVPWFVTVQPVIAPFSIVAVAVAL